MQTVYELPKKNHTNALYKEIQLHNSFNTDNNNEEDYVQQKISEPSMA